MSLKHVDMRYCYNEVFQAPSPDAYETLLIDVLRNDPGLFMRADQVEAAWAALSPIMDAWAHGGVPGIPIYPAGQWGPTEADLLIAQDGHTWLLPICLEPNGSCSSCK
jgi:glucose-6-phosphate 1-dehydrogenase